MFGVCVTRRRKTLGEDVRHVRRVNVDGGGVLVASSSLCPRHVRPGAVRGGGIAVKGFERPVVNVDRHFRASTGGSFYSGDRRG